MMPKLVPPLASFALLSSCAHAAPAPAPAPSPARAATSVAPAVEPEGPTSFHVSDDEVLLPAASCTAEMVPAVTYDAATHTAGVDGTRLVLSLPAGWRVEQERRDLLVLRDAEKVSGTQATFELFTTPVCQPPWGMPVALRRGAVRALDGLVAPRDVPDDVTRLANGAALPNPSTVWLPNTTFATPAGPRTLELLGTREIATTATYTLAATAACPNAAPDGTLQELPCTKAFLDMVYSTALRPE